MKNKVFSKYYFKDTVYKYIDIRMKNKAMISIDTDIFNNKFIFHIYNFILYIQNFSSCVLVSLVVFTKDYLSINLYFHHGVSPPSLYTFKFFLDFFRSSLMLGGISIPNDSLSSFASFSNSSSQYTLRSNFDRNPLVRAHGIKISFSRCC